METNIMFTATGITVTVTTASISMLCSGLIIFVILRSSEKLTTTYHRILFFISFFDIIYSLAIALTTLPMPKDVYETYPFAGIALGNATTCEIQGFTQATATTLVNWGGTLLSIYFLLRIGLKVPERIITCYVEPILYLFFLSFTVWSPGYRLYTKQLYNPVPYVPWCAIGDYPLGCNRFGFPCIRGQVFFRSQKAVFQYLWFFLIHIVCMAVVIIRVRWEESKLKSIIRMRINTPNGEESILTETRMHEMKLTKVVIKQACLYVGAFVLTYTITPNLTNYPKLANNGIRALVLVLKPLQGLWTMLIFVMDKLYMLRNANPGNEQLKRFLPAFSHLIRNSRSLPGAYVSQMSVVRHYGEEAEINATREREFEFGCEDNYVEIDEEIGGDDSVDSEVNDKEASSNMMLGNFNSSGSVGNSGPEGTTATPSDQEDMFCNEKDISYISKIDSSLIDDVSFACSFAGESGHLGAVSLTGISYSQKGMVDDDDDDDNSQEGQKQDSNMYDDSRKFALELSRDLSRNKK